MKNSLLAVIVMLLLFQLGCTQEIKNEDLVGILKKEYPVNVENLHILDIKNFRDKDKIVIYSFDFLSEHYVSWSKIREENNKIKVLINAGGVSTASPDLRPIEISVYKSEETDAEGLFSLIYGEVFDKRIKKIRLLENDNSLIITDVSKNNGYVFIREGEAVEYKEIEALDGDLNVIYKMINI